MTKTQRYIDPQGRIVIPNHIRNALNLNGNNRVEVALEEDGTIRIKAAKERCAICGGALDNGPCAELTEKKKVCYECAQKVARAMLKG